MRINRTGVAAALSAVALIGMPLVAAAPVAAQPLGAWDDPPPSGTPAPAEEDPQVLIEAPIVGDEHSEKLTLDEIVDNDIPPSSPEEAEQPGDFLAQTIEPVNDATEEAGVADLTADTVPAAEETSPEAPAVPDGPVEGETGNDDGDDADSGDAPTGDFGGDDSDTDAASADGSVPEGAEAQTDSADAAERSAAAASSSGLPDSGAAAANLLQIGLGLLTGGLLIAGTGRHRRTRQATARA